MPSVQQPRRAPVFEPGKKNMVTGMVRADLYAVTFVNGDSQKSMALVLVFGKDTEDGGPGVFVLADENQMAQQLLIANDTIKKGVRAQLARLAGATAEEIPEGASTAIDLTGEGPMDGAGDQPADITKLKLG